MVSEFSKMMNQAVDLRNELRNMQRLKDSLAALDWLQIPRPFRATSADLDLQTAAMAGAGLLGKFKLSLPADVTMLLNIIVRLGGFGRQLGSATTLESQLQPFAEQYIADEFSPKKLLRRASQTATGWQQLTRDLPRVLSIALAKFRNNDARLDINLHDADGVTDKVVDGLIGSAALLAAAPLLSSGTPPTLKGVSILGSLCALLAAGLLRRVALKRKDYRTLQQRVVALVKRFR